MKFYCLKNDKLYTVEAPDERTATLLCATHLGSEEGIEVWSERNAPGQLHMFDPPTPIKLRLFHLEFDAVYETIATCTVIAESSEEAEEIALRIAKDDGSDDDKIHDWDEPLDWDDRKLTFSKINQ